MTMRTRRDVLVSTVAAFAATVAGFEPVSAAADRKKGPVTHEVEIVKFKFVPARLLVRPGDTISWTNRDVVPHTATAINKSWDTRSIRKNMSKSLPVTADMSEAYYCRFHPAMKAQLELVVETSQ